LSSEEPSDVAANAICRQSPGAPRVAPPSLFVSPPKSSSSNEVKTTGPPPRLPQVSVPATLTLSAASSLRITPPSSASVAPGTPACTDTLASSTSTPSWFSVFSTPIVVGRLTVPTVTFK
jgi:hypothetical protein